MRTTLMRSLALVAAEAPQDAHRGQHGHRHPSGQRRGLSGQRGLGRTSWWASPIRQQWSERVDVVAYVHGALAPHFLALVHAPKLLIRLSRSTHKEPSKANGMARNIVNRIAAETIKARQRFQTSALAHMKNRPTFFAPPTTILARGHTT